MKLVEVIELCDLQGNSESILELIGSCWNFGNNGQLLVLALSYVSIRSR